MLTKRISRPSYKIFSVANSLCFESLDIFSIYLKLLIFIDLTIHTNYLIRSAKSPVAYILAIKQIFTW
jgi:hypothetical protein